MVFEGWLRFQDPLFIGHVPLLEAVSLTNLALSYSKMVKLSEFLSGTSIKELKLGFNSEKIWVQPEHPTECLASVFRQLRFVNLVHLPEGYDLTWTMYILEAAPLLKELYMTVCVYLKISFLTHGLNVRFARFSDQIQKMGALLTNYFYLCPFCWHARMGSCM